MRFPRPHPFPVPRCGGGGGPKARRLTRRAGRRPRTPAETYTSQGPNPYVFIVGCMRSGTTLLQRIVDSHPRLAILHELWWLVKWYKERIGMTPEGLVTPELVSRLLAFPKFTQK